MSETLSLFAPAKVNLFLHVLGRRENGYHDLESLVVFVDVGDTLHVTPADSFEFHISGPFAGPLSAEPAANNLVTRAAEGLADHAGWAGPRGARIELIKGLPVASGIGGGSADAAAALRILSHYWSLQIPQDKLYDLGLALGADVPVCLASEPRLMCGIGEQLSTVPPLPKTSILLVNPGVAVPTGQVFRALDIPSLPKGESAFGLQTEYPDTAALCETLAACRNDLEPPARALAPDIATVIDTIAGQDGCLLSRMSGSGATCFGLFHDQTAAAAAAKRLAENHPAWWVQSGHIMTHAPEPVLAEKQGLSVQHA